VKNCIAVFNTTFETYRAEEFFRNEKIRFRPILKPRKIGSACRMALRFAVSDIEAAKRAVRAGELDLKGFYVEAEDGWKPVE